MLPLFLGIDIELRKSIFHCLHKHLSLFIASKSKKHGGGKQKRAEDWDREWQEKLIIAEEKVGMWIPRVEEEQKEGGQQGKWAGGSTVPLQPPALACQTHSCLTKWFFAVKFHGKDVTAEDSTREHNAVFYCQKESACWGFSLSSSSSLSLCLCRCSL